MTTKRRRSSENLPPAGADDFERIEHIGAAIKSRLYAAGILTFEQLTTRTPDEIAAKLAGIPGMSAKLIVKQNWIGQARALATTPAPAQPDIDTSSQAELQDDSMSSAIQLHPASFTLILQLRKDNTIHHIHVTHHESKEQRSRPSWEEAVAFIAEHAGLRLPSAELAAQSALSPLPPATVEPASAPPAPVEPSSMVAAPVEPASGPLVSIEPASAPSAPVDPAPQLAATAGLVGVPHLRALEVVPADTDQPSRVLRHGQPFSVRLCFDLADISPSGDAPLNYTAAIYARNLSSRSHYTLGQAHGSITSATPAIVKVEGKPLAPGIYRLEATVALAAPSAVSSRPGPITMIESLLQVY